VFKLIPIILTLLTFPVPQEPKIVTCTVVDPEVSVRCGDDLYSVRQFSTDPQLDREARRQWRLVAPMRDGRPNVDAPLIDVPLKAGQQVKAIITAEKFQPVGTCEVRVWQGIKQWRQGGREGERIPNALYTSSDEDCQEDLKRHGGQNSTN
jgi:hypothetical protein